MAVNEVGEKYRCNICGNEVTVTKVGGEPVVDIRCLSSPPLYPCGIIFCVDNMADKQPVNRH